MTDGRVSIGGESSFRALNVTHTRPQRLDIPSNGCVETAPSDGGVDAKIHRIPA